MGLVILKRWLCGQDYKNERAPLLPTNEISSRLEREYDTRSTSSNQSGDTATSFRDLGQGSWISPRLLSDLIIGLSDGLTVPFALTAGLSSLGDAKVVITGGMAELVSGAISMGLGGYLAATGELEYYYAQLEKERVTFRENPDASKDSLRHALVSYGISSTTMDLFVEDLEKSPEEMVQFILRVDKGLEKPDDDRQFSSAFTMGLGYFVGGFIPLVPYFFADTVQTGLYISIVVMSITLYFFGVFRTLSSVGSDNAGKQKVMIDGIKMMLIGGVAAASAWGLVRFIDSKD